MKKKLVKICTKCKEEKSLDEFQKRNGTKDGYAYKCKSCIKQWKNEYHRKHPCKRVLILIKQRCTNKNKDGYKYYGGRGIKCLITEEELKELWFRDKAYLMKKSSIDREDSNGHYEYNNCRFMEQSKNCQKANQIPIVQFDLKGNFIKNWKSSKEASDFFGSPNGNITYCLKEKTRKAYGFIWRYKNEI